MHNNHVILASTGSALRRVENQAGQWEIDQTLDGVKINCIVQNPASAEQILLGTQSDGVLISKDGGKSWRSLGLHQIPVKSLAIDPADPNTIYAGGKPVSLFVTHDGGETWIELPAMRKMKQFWWFSPADPPGMHPYVNALSVSPADPNVILAGIELGAVLRSDDRGLSWSKHLPGCDRDCHALIYHAQDGNWAYEAGGLSGVSFSRDGGKNWRKPKEGLGTKYGWAVAADPVHSEIWYLSAAEPANLMRGEFTPPGHHDGQANAHLFRKQGDASWVQLSGGLPEPLDYMAYGLSIVPGQTGHLYAGLANGEVWHTADYGEHWGKMPMNVGRVNKLLVLS